MDTETKLKVVCICSDYLQMHTSVELMKKYGNSDFSKGVRCCNCYKTVRGQNEIVYACNNLENSYHPKGYGFCVECANTIIDEEEKNDVNLQFHDLLHHRLTNRMDYLLKTQTKIDLNQGSVRILPRLLHQVVYRLWVQKQYLIKQNEYEKQVGLFAFKLLDIKTQYEWINNQISIIDYDNQQHVAKLCDCCTIYCYCIRRLQSECSIYNDTLKEYYYKFVIQQNQLYDKLNFNARNNLYHCTCGRLRAKLWAADCFPESKSVVTDCSICNTSISYDECKTMYRCEYGGIGCIWTTCENCILSTKCLKRMNVVNFGKEFARDYDNYSKSNELNENFMHFFSLIFDRFDQTINEPTNIFQKAIDQFQRAVRRFGKHLQDKNKNKVQIFKMDILRKRLKMSNNIMQSEYSLKVDDKLLNALQKKNKPLIEFDSDNENVIKIDPLKYLFDNRTCAANTIANKHNINSNTISIIDQILYTFDDTDQKECSSNNFILGLGIQTTNDKCFRIYIIAKSMPLFIQCLSLEIYLFIDELKWCFLSTINIRNVVGKISYDFKRSAIEKMKIFRASMYVKIKDIRCKNCLSNVFGIKKIKDNYVFNYNNILEKFKNKTVIDNKQRYWYEFNISKNQLKLFWKGQKIYSDIITCDIYNNPNETDKLQFNQITCQISLQKSGNIDNVLKIEVKTLAKPPFLNVSMTGDYFIPQLKFHKRWGDGDNNGEFHSDLLKSETSVFEVIYFSLQFHCKTHDFNKNIPSVNAFKATQQLFEDNFNDIITTKTETHKFNGRKQLHTLHISGDNKTKFDNNTEIFGEILDLFPFPIFDYVMNCWVRENNEKYIPLEVVSLIKMFTPNIFKDESFKISLSITKNQDGYLRINFNAISTLRYMKTLRFNTEYWIPQVLYYRDNVSAPLEGITVGYTTNNLVSQLKSLHSFDVNVGSVILDSNMDIINQRKKYFQQFTQKTDSIMIHSDKHKLTLRTIFELNGKSLESLFEQKKWTFGPKMKCDIVSKSECKPITTIVLVPSWLIKHGFFYHGIDFESNKKIAKILMDIHFIRPQMMDHYASYGMTFNEGRGKSFKCLAQDGFVEMKDMEFTSFTVDVVIHISKVWGKDSKEIQLKEFECCLCNTIYYQLNDYERHLKSSGHSIKEVCRSMKYSPGNWHQMDSF